MKSCQLYGAVEQSQRIIDYRLPNDFESPIHGASNAPSTKKISYTQRAIATLKQVCKFENVEISKKWIFKFLNPMGPSFRVVCEF